MTLPMLPTLLFLACAAPIRLQADPDALSAPGSADTADTAPDTGDTADTAPGTADAWIVISDPRSEDADGDGRWEAGEALTITVTMENTRAEDYMHYPGVLVTTETPGVEIPMPGGGWFYGIFGLDREALSMQVIADAGIAEGTEAEFRLALDAINCESMPGTCLGDQVLIYRRTIGR